MTNRVINFYAGPAGLPLPALQRAADVGRHDVGRTGEVGGRVGLQRALVDHRRCRHRCGALHGRRCARGDDVGFRRDGLRRQRGDRQN